MARAINAQPYLTLDRYRQLMNLPMCYFNGVERSGESTTACDHCWSQWEREMVAQALYDAENNLAVWLGFKLGFHFEEDLDHVWTDPLLLNWGHIVGAGIQGLTDVTATVTASDFTVDPALITIPQTSFTGGASEILITETATGLEIVPDSITATGANYVIAISQCKLIEWDNLENQTQDTCIDYSAVYPAATWLKLADLTIYREYLDTTHQATIEFGPDCACWYCGASCSGTQYSGCVYVIDEEISKVRVQMSDYDAATASWTCSSPVLCGCYSGDKVASVHYLAGTTSVPGWEQAVIRLAHTYIVVEPCGCTLFDAAVHRDRRIPTVLTAERINNPLGEMDGSWYAWQWLMNHKQGRAYML
jgi:hypothetical protein